MAAEGAPGGPIPRVSREEFAPRVGDPAQKLARLPGWGQSFVPAAIEALKQLGVGSVALRFHHTGSNPHTLEAVISKPNGGDSQIEVEVSGDWSHENAIPQGVPLIASFDGMFYRRAKPTDTNPMADEGAIIEPDGPIGIAAKGKSAYWQYPLPGRDFPNGGRIAQFTCPNDPKGMEVVKNETVICYVEKL
jgi:hypothetical protein